MATLQGKISVTVRELNQLLAKGSTVELLDVRTPVEFSAVHVPGAKLVPLDELDADAFLKDCGAGDNPIYVLCQSGGRARKAIEKFKRSGFDGCLLVEGGTQAWVDAGLPVNRGRAKVISLERQVRIAAGLLVLAGVVLGWFVHPGFFGLAAFIGAGLVFAGVTDFCGMGMLLAKMPWNQRARGTTASCCDAKH
jgi:rhodanese-related sulfurtransferase